MTYIKQQLYQFLQLVIQCFSIKKFDLEDTRKLVAMVALSEMTREYLIKQKILPDHINV